MNCFSSLTQNYFIFFLVLLGAQLSSRCFLNENATLFWKNSYKWIIEMNEINERRKSTFPANVDCLAQKSQIFTQPKVYDTKTKSLMCQNGLFTMCLSLIHDVLGMSKSNSTYCWSHLLTNSGNLVAHLIIITKGK